MNRGRGSRGGGGGRKRRGGGDEPGSAAAADVRGWCGTLFSRRRRYVSASPAAACGSQSAGCADTYTFEEQRPRVVDECRTWQPHSRRTTNKISLRWKRTPFTKHWDECSDNAPGVGAAGAVRGRCVRMTVEEIGAPNPAARSTRSRPRGPPGRPSEPPFVLSVRVGGRCLPRIRRDGARGRATRRAAGVGSRERPAPAWRDARRRQAAAAACPTAAPRGAVRSPDARPQPGAPAPAHPPTVGDPVHPARGGSPVTPVAPHSFRQATRAPAAWAAAFERERRRGDRGSSPTGAASPSGGAPPG